MTGKELGKLAYFLRCKLNSRFYGPVVEEIGDNSKMGEGAMFAFSGLIDELKKFQTVNSIENSLDRGQDRLNFSVSARLGSYMYEEEKPEFVATVILTCPDEIRTFEKKFFQKEITTTDWNSFRNGVELIQKEFNTIPDNEDSEIAFNTLRQMKIDSVNKTTQDNKTNTHNRNTSKLTILAIVLTPILSALFLNIIQSS